MLRTPPPQALNTYFLAITGSPNPQLSPNLLRLAVGSRYGSARWALLFSGSAVPSDNAVPIGEPINVAANGSVVRDWQPQGLPVNSPGLVIVASSTAATLTKDASATWDIEADVEEWETQKPSASVAGDLTTPVSSLTVWSEAAGATAKKLLKVEIINGVAAVRYAAVFAVDTPLTSSNIISWTKFAASEKRELNYGMNGGLAPYQQNADATEHRGCVIACLTSLNPIVFAVATDFKIKATYA